MGPGVGVLLVQYPEIYASVLPVPYAHGKENQNYRVLSSSIE